MRLRIADLIADSAAVGIGAATALNALDWAARHGSGGLAAPEAMRLRIVAASLGLLFAPLRGVSRAGGAAIAALAVLCLWAPARRLTARLFIAAAAAWVAALTGVGAYMLDPAAALGSAPLAALLTAWIASRRRSSVVALLVLVAGLGAGFFLAQNLFIARPEVTGGINPGYGFAPLLLLSLWLARWAARRAPDPPMRFGRRLLRVWGLTAVCLGLALPVAVEAVWGRRRPADPSMVRVTDEFAYDVRIDGEPPAIVWTNRRRAQVIENAYGDAHRGYPLDERAGFSERIWPDPRGGFYIQEGKTIAWWAAVPDHQPIPSQPSASYVATEWNPAGFVEDPLGRRTLLVSEWGSQYMVVDRATDRVIARGAFSEASFPFPFAALDPATRTVFISTSMDDGNLYAFDFASLRVTRRAPDLFLYSTVIDPDAGLLWGARPFTGEVLGVDMQSLAVRHRIPVEPAVRDIERDPRTGDLYTCSMLFGDVFRVDPRALAATKIGWCGRQCRNLFVDSPRRTLWIATADGLCRLPLSGGGDPAGSARTDG